MVTETGGPGDSRPAEDGVPDDSTRPAEKAEATPDRVATTACQFSVYPLRRLRIGDAVEAAIEAAAAEGVTVKVQNLSTLIHGDEQSVFNALRAAFRAVQADGSAVLVATLAAGMPSDTEIARIQKTHEPGGAHDKL
jgi:uncharacterized protein YqgV (UPF0045/DUF77 family)